MRPVIEATDGSFARPSAMLLLLVFLGAPKRIRMHIAGYKLTLYTRVFKSLRAHSCIFESTSIKVDSFFVSHNDVVVRFGRNHDK